MSEATQTADTMVGMHGAGGELHEPHHPGIAAYVIVAVALCVLTGGEIAVSYTVGLQIVEVPLLLLLALGKFLLIALFFMHLKYDSWVLSYFFLGGLAAALLIMIALLLLFAYLSHKMML